MKIRLMSLGLTLAVVAFAMWALGAALAQGAALTADRDTPQRTGEFVSLPVASNVVVYAGSMAAASNGYAVGAANTAGHAVIGRAETAADNRGVNYMATKRVAIARGVFRWANADNITAADIGKLAYVTDDHTVNKAGGGANIIAGSIVDVDAYGVWVDTGKIGPSGAATPSSLAVAANATVGGTLGVTGTATFTNIVVNGTTVTAPNLPTATNGLTPGRIYSDSGTLKVF